MDDDTGIVARYGYALTDTQGGQVATTAYSFELRAVGSPTVETPDWAP